MFRWLALFLFLPLAALAQDLPQPRSDTVSDYDDVLPPDSESRLSDLLKQARSETGVHVVVVAMERREDHGGQGRSIEDYAKQLFNRWGVGDRTRNDGVMILVSKTDREMRIQLGSGYGSEWDGVAQGVIDRSFLPSFRKGDYAKGIEQGTAAVIDRIARRFAAGQPAQDPTPPAQPVASNPTPKVVSRESGWTNALLIPLMIVGVLALKARRYIGDILIRQKPCPHCGKKGLHRTRIVTSQPSYSSDGWGEETTACDFCDYRQVAAYSIPMLRERDNDRSGGSSGGGFGGGRSSGGGATGRW